MLPLHTHVSVDGPLPQNVFKVVTPEEQLACSWPADRCLVWDPDGRRDTAPLVDKNRHWGGWLTSTARRRDCAWSGIWINNVRNRQVIGAGDVIRLRSGSSLASILFRRGSNSNTLFATDRCNSLCLMCSQPPRDERDDWRVQEILDVISLVDRDEEQLGITGGEPTLLGDGLLQVIAACKDQLPQTFLHILTNGRRFADASWSRAATGVGHPRIMWAVPVYADGPDLHDYIVQARGAFDETLRGLYHLAVARSAVEIRVVLHRLTVPRLGALANFIYRNLPFVRHVALMGLEPMGFAKINRELLWIDPLDYVSELSDACLHLHARGMNVSIYNLPLCVLPQHLWQFARRSISDWKNDFASECGGCAIRDQCAGFFKSAGNSWRSRGIHAITATQGGEPSTAAA